MKGAAPTSLPNIILIGLMGCGKTTIGKELHRETSLRFTDTDQMIEHQTGMSIPQIFKAHGESDAPTAPCSSSPIPKPCWGAS